LIYFSNIQEAEREMCRGIILLQNCYVTERPSKKDGYCIKIFNTLDHPIFCRQDLRGKPLNKPLGNSNYCLLRLKSKEEGKDWLVNLIKATPDFEKPKDEVKDNDSDSSDDDGDESDDHKDSSLEEAQERPTFQLDHTNSPTINATNPSPKKDTRTPKIRKQVPSDSRKDPSKTPILERNEITGKLPPNDTALNNYINSGISANDLKDALSKLRSSLREELNKVIETKLDEQSKNLTTKIQTTESRLAYSLRLPTPPLVPPSHKNNMKSDSIKHRLTNTLKTQVSLNTLLLFLIIYLLLSIFWIL